MIELLVVCLFGLLIGAGVGAVSSVNVANSLLENEISNATEDMENINQNFGGGMENDKGGSHGKNNDMKINGVVNIEQVDSIEVFWRREANEKE